MMEFVYGGEREIFKMFCEQEGNGCDANLRKGMLVIKHRQNSFGGGGYVEDYNEELLNCYIDWISACV